MNFHVPKAAKWGAAAVFAVAAGIYSAASLHSHNGSEFKIVMNKGNAVSVTSKGLVFAWGLYDTTHSFPQTRQITTVADQDLTLRSKDGEEFVGGLRIEYQFRFKEGEQHEQANKSMIMKLFKDFNITNTKVFWDTEQVDPVEKTVKARAQTAAVEVFALMKTDDYQGKIKDTRESIKKRLQDIVDAEQLPIEIVEVDSSGVSPHPDVQARINRIASERRESERADVTIENADKVKEATRKEAESALEFAKPLREAGYSEETIVALNCQRLADRADRFGIPFGVNCQGGGSNVGVVVDPSKVTPAQKRSAPAAPVAGAASAARP